jgi:hypothetical protein
MYDGTSRATAVAVVMTMGAAVSTVLVSTFVVSLALTFDSERLQASPVSETASAQPTSAAARILREMYEENINRPVTTLLL